MDHSSVGVLHGGEGVTAGLYGQGALPPCREERKVVVPTCSKDYNATVSISLTGLSQDVESRYQPSDPPLPRGGLGTRLLNLSLTNNNPGHSMTVISRLPLLKRKYMYLLR